MCKKIDKKAIFRPSWVFRIESIWQPPLVCDINIWVRICHESFNSTACSILRIEWTMPPRMWDFEFRVLKSSRVKTGTNFRNLALKCPMCIGFHQPSQFYLPKGSGSSFMPQIGTGLKIWLNFLNQQPDFRPPLPLSQYLLQCFKWISSANFKE